jgi:hypothetical protein
MTVTELVSAAAASVGVSVTVLLAFAAFSIHREDNATELHCRPGSADAHVRWLTGLSVRRGAGRESGADLLDAVSPVRLDHLPDACERVS